MNKHMNANTAERSATTQKIESTDTALGVTSLTETTIEQFISRHASAADLADSSGATDLAARAQSLGFGKSANVRWSRFLEVFRANPHLTERYKEKYPLCSFLPWSAFHEIMRILDLWCDLSDHYIGGIPEEALLRLELLDFDTQDKVELLDRSFADMPQLMGEKWTELLYNSLRKQGEHNFWCQVPSEFVKSVRRYVLEAETKFFVLAPADAFSSEQDWLKRFRRLAYGVEDLEKTPPDDPLVVRFVMGGVLVVAAWGDEAAEINKVTRDLKL